MNNLINKEYIEKKFIKNFNFLHEIDSSLIVIDSKLLYMDDPFSAPTIEKEVLGVKIYINLDNIEFRCENKWLITLYNIIKCMDNYEFTNINEMQITFEKIALSFNNRNNFNIMSIKHNNFEPLTYLKIIYL